MTARRPEARLWIIGDGPARETLYRQIGDLDQRFRAFLPGTFDCLDELVQASDMLLLPSPHKRRRWSCCRPRQPACPSSRPNRRGLGNALAQQTGLLYPRRHQRLANAIVELMENPATAFVMAPPARAGTCTSDT